MSQMEAPVETRKSKQDYVFELWNNIGTRTAEIVDNLDNSHEGFEKLSKFLQDPMINKLFKHFWIMLTSFCLHEKVDKDTLAAKQKDNNITKTVKICLSTLMITKFPETVLDINSNGATDTANMDPLTTELYNAALTVAKILFEGYPASVQNASKLHCEEIVKSITHYRNCFDAWQSKDILKVVESVSNMYLQWAQSHKILKNTQLNAIQKKGALKTMEKNMQSCRERIVKLVGNHQAKIICDEIDERVANAPAIPSPKSSPPNPFKDNNGINTIEEEEEEHKESIEEQLARKGVPINMKTGANLVRSNNGNNNGNDKPMSEEDKYTEMTADGKKVLNLDKIIMEEASKNYWTEFENEIEKNNWKRLFELISELLERIKKLSPSKQHATLDDLMDVSFIQQTIQNGVLDAKGFYGIFYGIWEQIKSLHPPAEDKAWSDWHDSVYEQMQSPDATWAKLLPQVFNAVLRKLDRIEDQVKAIHAIRNAKK